MQLIDDVLRKRYTELQQQGRSEAEIEKIFSDIDYGAAMIELIETMSSDHVDLFEKTMYERVLQERVHTDEFISRNEQIWGKGFVFVFLEKVIKVFTPSRVIWIRFDRGRPPEN